MAQERHIICILSLWTDYLTLPSDDWTKISSTIHHIALEIGKGWRVWKGVPTATVYIFIEEPAMNMFKIGLSAPTAVLHTIHRMLIAVIFPFGPSNNIIHGSRTAYYWHSVVMNRLRLRYITKRWLHENLIYYLLHCTRDTMYQPVEEEGHGKGWRRDVRDVWGVKGVDGS